MRFPDDARHATGAIFRVAGNATHPARDVDHPAPRGMQAPYAIGHSPEAVLQVAQDAVQRTRCAGQGTLDALHGAQCALHLPKDVKSARKADFLN
jgi:hypothetical protein